MSTTNFVKGECGQCAGHLEFAAGAVGSIVQCPHCGRPTELVANLPPARSAGPRRLVAGIVAAILLAAGLVAAISFFIKATPAGISEKSAKPAARATATSRPADETNTNGFTVPAIKLEKAPGSSLVYVTGKIRNLAGRQRFGVKLEFGLFDTNGLPAGKATDYCQVLEPQADWIFKALVFDARAASARLNFIHEDQ